MEIVDNIDATAHEEECSLERKVGPMPFDSLQLESEAPSDRAEEIHRVLGNLGLPEGPLSHDDLEIVALAIALRGDLYEDLVVDDETSRSWMLLFRNPAYEVRLLTWEREQSSDWHDHGGSSGAFAVTSGVLLERHRGDDHVGVVSGHFGVGQFGAFGPDYVHDIMHGAGSPAVSIHVYSPPLSGLTFYERTEFGFVAKAFVPEEDRSSQRSTPTESVDPIV
jgi:hypothetical protein